jgi:predicted transcriptional regulator
MRILLSIKPKYANLIIEGVKKYEFRRQIFRKRIEKAYIYCTRPVKKIIGYFTVEEILSDKPKKIWKLCRDQSGIAYEEFFAYFKNSEIAFAIKIGKVKKLNIPIEIKDLDVKIPQSFCYVNSDFEKIQNFNLIDKTINLLNNYF